MFFYSFLLPQRACWQPAPSFRPVPRGALLSSVQNPSNFRPGGSTPARPAESSSSQLITLAASTSQLPPARQCFHFFFLFFRIFVAVFLLCFFVCISTNRCVLLERYRLFGHVLFAACIHSRAPGVLPAIRSCFFFFSLFRAQIQTFLSCFAASTSLSARTRWFSFIYLFIMLRVFCFFCFFFSTLHGRSIISPVWLLCTGTVGN